MSWYSKIELGVSPTGTIPDRYPLGEKETAIR